MDKYQVEESSDDEQHERPSPPPRSSKKTNHHNKTYYVYLLDAQLSRRYGVPASKFCEQDFRGRTRVKGTSTKDQILLWHRMELINQQHWLQQHGDIFKSILKEKPLSQQINCNNWIEEIDTTELGDPSDGLPDDSRAYSAACAALMAASRATTTNTNTTTTICRPSSCSNFNRVSVKSG